MAATLEKIVRDLAALDQTVELLGTDLHQAYQAYLVQLSTAARQQLSLAAYHVCTQGYPEAFLALSYGQRQTLLTQVRQLGQTTATNLQALLRSPQDFVQTQQLRPPAHADAAAPQHQPQPQLQTQAQSNRQANFSEDVPEALSEALSENLPDQPKGFNLQDFNLTGHDWPLTSNLLIAWVQDLEQSLHEELRSASFAINRLFQQSGILPKHLPEPVLAAAAKVELADMGNSTPNILNVMVGAIGDLGGDLGPGDELKALGHLEIVGELSAVGELEVMSELKALRERLESDAERDADGPEKSADSAGEHFTKPEPGSTRRRPEMLQVIAVHLRLGDIEFADPSTAAARTQLRGLMGKLKSTAKTYKKKLREQAVAQAQQAWRSSWSED